MYLYSFIKWFAGARKVLANHTQKEGVEMGTFKAGQSGRRVLQKNNTGTYTVTLPIELVRQLKWQDGQKVTLTKRGKSIVITDWKG